MAGLGVKQLLSKNGRTGTMRLILWRPLFLLIWVNYRLNPEQVSAGFQSQALTEMDTREEKNLLCLWASTTGTFVRSSKHSVRETIVVTFGGEVRQTVRSYFPF